MKTNSQVLLSFKYNDRLDKISCFQVHSISEINYVLEKTQFLANLTQSNENLGEAKVLETDWQPIDTVSSYDSPGKLYISCEPHSAEILTDLIGKMKTTKENNSHLDGAWIQFISDHDIQYTLFLEGVLSTNIEWSDVKVNGHPTLIIELSYGDINIMFGDKAKQGNSNFSYFSPQKSKNYMVFSSNDRARCVSLCESSPFPGRGDLSVPKPELVNGSKILRFTPRFMASKITLSSSYEEASFDFNDDLECLRYPKNILDKDFFKQDKLSQNATSPSDIKLESLIIDFVVFPKHADLCGLDTTPDLSFFDLMSLNSYNDNEFTNLRSVWRNSKNDMQSLRNFERYDALKGKIFENNDRQLLSLSMYSYDAKSGYIRPSGDDFKTTIQNVSSAWNESNFASKKLEPQVIGVQLDSGREHFLGQIENWQVQVSKFDSNGLPIALNCKLSLRGSSIFNQI